MGRSYGQKDAFGRKTGGYIEDEEYTEKDYGLSDDDGSRGAVSGGGGQYFTELQQHHCHSGSDDV